MEVPYITVAPCWKSETILRYRVTKTNQKYFLVSRKYPGLGGVWLRFHYGLAVLMTKNY